MIRAWHSLEAAASMLLIFQVDWIKAVPKVVSMASMVPVDGGNLLLGVAGAGLFLRVYVLQVKEMDRLQARIKGLESKVEEIERSTDAELAEERKMRRAAEKERDEAQASLLDAHLLNESLMTRLMTFDNALTIKEVQAETESMKRGRRSTDGNGEGI